MKAIYLGQNKFTYVDDEDFEELSKYRWHFQKTQPPHNGAAATHVKTSKGWRSALMHRIIMKAPKGITVDHRNHDSLDNTRKNLRLATSAQQTYNKRKYKTNKTGFKGVSFLPKINKYLSCIHKEGKQYRLGYFKTKEEAAAAYAEAAPKFHGEFAHT